MATTWRGAFKLGLRDVAEVQSALNIAVEPQISYVLGAWGISWHFFELDIRNEYICDSMCSKTAASCRATLAALAAVQRAGEANRTEAGEEPRWRL